jgi:hypothetical protein
MVTLGAHGLVPLDRKAALGRYDAYIPIVADLIRGLEEGISYTHCYGQNHKAENEQRQIPTGWNKMDT